MENKICYVCKKLIETEDNQENWCESCIEKYSEYGEQEPITKLKKRLQKHFDEFE